MHRWLGIITWRDIDPGVMNCHGYFVTRTFNVIIGGPMIFCKTILPWLEWISSKNRFWS